MGPLHLCLPDECGGWGRLEEARRPTNVPKVAEGLGELGPDSQDAWRGGRAGRRVSCPPLASGRHSGPAADALCPGGERGAAAAAATVRASAVCERTHGVAGGRARDPERPRGAGKRTQRRRGSSPGRGASHRAGPPPQAEPRPEAPCWEEALLALVSGNRGAAYRAGGGRALSEDGGPAAACRGHPEAEPAAGLRARSEGRQRHLRGRLQGQKCAYRRISCSKNHQVGAWYVMLFCFVLFCLWC
uniref:Homeobox protein cut-like 1 n=1 Tax=Castor canadensis TaxID=51338 RepID=A0A8B7ULV9_CASCN|nr:homeobox protein cut-like 1 [Castor canadensis]